MEEKIKLYKELIRKNDDNEADFTDYEFCKKCVQSRPTCCQLTPCELSPTDLIKVTKENILKLLETELVVLDCYEGDLTMFGYNEYPKVWFLRMRGENEGTGVVLGWGDNCICLKEGVGCMIDFNHRAYHGRRMPSCNKITNKDEYQYNSKILAAQEWRPYFHLLDEIANEVGSDCDDIISDLFETILKDLFK